MKHLSWRFLRMWQRNGDVFLKLWHAEAPVFVAEPVLVLLAMGVGLGAYIGLVDGQDYIEFIVPGIIASYGMFSACFECTYSSYFRMEERKTYDAVIATPLSIEDVIAGEIFWGATRALITGSAIVVVAAAFQLVPSPWAVLIPVLSFLSGLMFSAISILFTSVAPSLYSFNYYYTLFMTPMFFFSGVFFPLSSFPEIVQSFSWIIPLRPVVEIARGLVRGEFQMAHLMALGIIVGMTLVFFSLSLVSMRRRLFV